MEYDLLKMGRKGVNWGEDLSNYQRILNEDPKEVLGYKTPFEVYFARRSNSLDRTSTPGMEKELLKNKIKCNPSYADRKRRQKHVSVVKKDAHTATARCDRRMKQAYARTNLPSKYAVGEKVYVRLRGKGRLQKKRCVTEAVIEKRNLKRHLYKVSYTSPERGKNEKKWLAVDGLTSLTLREEKNKQRVARLSKQQKENHRAKFLIPLEKEDYEKIIEDQGFVIKYNPPGNGNCQFAALAHQLNDLGILRSPETLRDEIVEYLESNPLDHDGFPLLELVPECETWGDYLLYMMQNQTFGDQLTLYAAANLYNVNVRVISSLGVGADHTFSLSSSIPLTTVYLGHFAENHGEHYVSLTPGVQNSVSGCNDFMEDEDDGGDAINDDDRPNVADVSDDAVQYVSRDSETSLLVEFMAQTIHKISNF